MAQKFKVLEGYTMTTGDVIQITDEKHHWFPCLLIVDEMRSWGVVAYVLMPHNGGTPTGRAYIRLQNGEFEAIGPAIFATAHSEDLDE